MKSKELYCSDCGKYIDKDKGKYTKTKVWWIRINKKIYCKNAMQLQNRFDNEVRHIFLYVYWCFKCQRSDQGIELHHITGRDSNSMINACPLCTECHQHIKHTKEEEHELREYSLIYYVGNKIDIPEKDIIYLKDIDYPLYKKYHSVLKLSGEHL